MAMPELKDAELWDDWRKTWVPIRIPCAKLGENDLPAFTFDPHDPGHARTLRRWRNARSSQLWTVRDAGSLALSICAGLHVVDRLGYVVTRRAHSGCEATPMFVLGDPDLSVVPEEMTDEELREALEDYEAEATKLGEHAGVARRNLALLREERTRRTRGAE